MALLVRPPRKRSSAGELNRGLSSGAEFAGVILVFFFGGFALDRWLDSGPWFTLGLTLFGVVGVFVRTWYAYVAEMERHEQRRAANRTVGAPVASRESEGSAA